MEDEGKYSCVKSETLHKRIEAATAQEKEQYALTNTQMRLFYTVITAKNTKAR